MRAPMDRLSKRERQDLILKRLENDVAVQIAPLAAELDVTTETIRRDLDQLSGRGLLARTYGGAAVRSLSAEPGVQTRARAYVEERARIAARARALVSSGDVLMIDAGSTTAHLAEALARSGLDLTVITNSLGVARFLGPADSLQVILCPGTLRSTEDGVYGQETTSFLDKYRADLAFIGCGGFSAREITDADPNAVWVKRKMLARAKRSVLVADASKAGVEQYAGVCGWNEIGALITEARPPDDVAAALAAHSTELILA
jgi:DeoR/GlpR family transcriptional regulator of sugar metabolism